MLCTNTKTEVDIGESSNGGGMATLRTETNTTIGQCNTHTTIVIYSNTHTPLTTTLKTLPRVFATAT